LLDDIKLSLIFLDTSLVCILSVEQVLTATILLFILLDIFDSTVLAELLEGINLKLVHGCIDPIHAIHKLVDLSLNFLQGLLEVLLLFQFVFMGIRHLLSMGGYQGMLSL
jgi:hypothetical protein